MGDCGVAGHPERERGRREVPVARAVAPGCVEVGQSVNRPPVLERPVHAAAHQRQRSHHLQKELAHLGGHETKSTSDYSACTTWGVFYNEEENDAAQVILLDAFKDRMQFPELKATALKHYKEWEPDAFIVEKKAAGAPLIQELRRMGIPVQETNPSRGNDKVVRLNAVADLFSSGTVWAPDTRWAREVIEEVASFPNGENDDYVDTTSQALLRFRQGGFISLNTDEKDDPIYFRRKAAYY